MNYLLRHYLSTFLPSAVFALLLLVVSIPKLLASNDSIIVVVAKDSPITQLSREEVADLFLGKRKYQNNIQITPIDSADNALHEHFYLTLTEMNNIRIKAYWSRIVFSGQGRPPSEASIAEAIARVKAEPGTLTYLPANQPITDIKVVLTLP